MAEITLVLETGRPTGSAASRRLRASGRIPGVVYGHGISGESVSVDARELRHALSGEAGLNQLLSLQVGSQSHLALARALQRHPVRHTVLHVDFQVVSRDEIVAADVPIVLTGEARAVELDQGIIEHILTTLTVHATPARIPASIDVDISDMSVGEGIRVLDLKLPSGVTTDVPGEEIVVIAAVSRVAAEVEAVEAAEAEAAAEAAAEAPEAEAGGAAAGEAADAEAQQGAGGGSTESSSGEG
jgi:large subunit ribosomal protein L25